MIIIVLFINHHETPRNKMRLSILLFMLTVYAKHRMNEHQKIDEKKKQCIALMPHDNNFILSAAYWALHHRIKVRSFIMQRKNK